ncbi:MAG: hypothetical protein PVSMB6_16390 [Steroidobacteraceae bacterium]
MRTHRRLAGSLWCAALVVVPCAGVLAKQAPATTPAATARPIDIPPPDQLEPAVKTTVPASAASGPAPSASAHALTATPPPASAPAPAAQRPGSGRARKGADRLELETTDITGNRELPKVLYIVPWKRSDLSDLAGKPPNSLLDEVLQPIDRDVFQRENRYYDALQPDTKGAKSGAAPLSGDKP